MAKDNKRDGTLGGARSAGQDNKKKVQQDIDVSSASLEENKSDSDLDIQALLRKYMPEYDSDEGEDTEDAGVLSRLKKSVEAEAAEDTLFAEADDAIDLPEAEGEEASQSLLKALDSVFSDLAESDEEADDAFSMEEVSPAQKLEADDFMFTDDIPAQIEDSGELEDEEGIYEDDEEVSRAPKRKKEARGGLFGFGRRNKKHKQDEYADLLNSSAAAEEEPAETDAANDDLLQSLLGEQEEPAAVENVPEVSEAEMLKLAEDLLRDSEESAEEEAAPAAVEDDEFDPTDINLMVAFGMEEGENVKKKAGKTARQLGDKLEHEKAAGEGKKVKLDRPEYVDRSQNADIEKSYKNKMLALWIKLGLCSVFTVLLMLYENIEYLAKLFTGTAKQFGGAFDPAIYPVVYAMVSLQLMLLACLCAYEQILKGFGCLVRGIPRPESIASLMTVAGILYTVVVARITVQSDEPVMFNFVVACTALLALVGDIFNTRREMLNFRVVSAAGAKHIVCRVSDEESRGESTAFSEEDDVCDVMRIEKADFINGFFNRMYKPDAVSNVFISCTMGIMAAAAVLFGIFASVRGGSAVEVARTVCIALMALAPLSVFTALSYPFYRVNVMASESDSAIIGEASLEEYSNASIITFDDKNVFPSYGVKVQNIRIFNNARIDRVLYYAASVFDKAGGPLQDVFEIATLEVGHSGSVNILDTEAGFLAAEVDGVNIIFGSGAALSKKGFQIRKQELEDDVDLSDELSIMYMFREDRLVAKMYIQYVMDSDIELILGQFQNSGLYGCVRTFDPNIDERMIARKVNMKRIPMKVIRYNDTEEVNGYTEKADSGLVTCGSPKSLLQIISYCEKILHIRKTNFSLAILAILLAAAIMLLLVLSGSVDRINSLGIAIYQLGWLAVSAIATKAFIR